MAVQRDVSQAPARRVLPARAPRTRWGIRCRRDAAGGARRRRPARRARCAADPGACAPARSRRLERRRRAAAAGRTRLRTAPVPRARTPGRPCRSCPAERRAAAGSPCLRRARADGHAVGEFAHCRRADPGEELITVGEVPVCGSRAPRPPSVSLHGEPSCPGRRCGPARAPRRPGRRGRRLRPPPLFRLWASPLLTG